MREAHAHIPSHGHALITPRLDDCATLAECLERVRTAAAGRAPDDWVRLTNARPEAWPEQRWPTADELDIAADHRPCALMSFDHHSLAANHAAMTRARITPDRVFSIPGAVVTDPSTNRPTGLLLEDAAYAVWTARPEPTLDEHRAAVRRALDDFARLGFDEVHDLLTPDWLPTVLADLDRAGQLPVAVHLYPPIDRLAHHAEHTRPALRAAPRVRLVGGKLFADGTLNSRTAFLLHPYRHPAAGIPPVGQALVSPARVQDCVRLTESLGLHLAVHAIGDGAVRLVLDAIEAASTNPSARHRIEHCELIDPADVPRFARLGVVCSVQPCHLLTDIEVLTRQLPHRLDHVLPLRALIDSGCTPLGPSRDGLLWFGSDAPIVRPDPDDSLFAAIHRRRPSQPPSAALAPHSAITPAEARACFGVARQ